MFNSSSFLMMLLVFGLMSIANGFYLAYLSDNKFPEMNDKLKQKSNEYKSGNALHRILASYYDLCSSSVLEKLFFRPNIFISYALGAISVLYAIVRLTIW